MTRKLSWTKALALAALLSGGLSSVTWAAGFFTNGVPIVGGSQYPSTAPLTGNELIPADTQLPSGQNPQSVAIPSSNLMGGNGLPKNYLANGAMNIAQQGTGTITCGTSTPPTNTAFAADRWFCDVNVTSGAGRSVSISASPAPPNGFQNAISLFRTSGALLQPVCVMQEIETSRAVQLQGRFVVLSAYVQSLGALFSAANGNVNAYIITGTGTDQGFGSLTANPAITPAWTNITFNSTAGNAANTTATPPAAATWVVPGGTAGGTASWTRYTTPGILIPALVAGSATTEVGVMICFTPVGTGSGATDGIAITGVQLEAIGPATTLAGTFSTISASTAAGVNATAFEFRSVQDDLRDAQRFFWQYNEPASGAATPFMCGNVASGSQICPVALPVPMRGTTPVIAIPTTGTFKMNISGTTPTTWATPAAGTCSNFACTVTAATVDATIGSIAGLNGGGGSGVITVVNDKVM